MLSTFEVTPTANLVYPPSSGTHSRLERVWKFPTDQFSLKVKARGDQGCEMPGVPCHSGTRGRGQRFTRHVLEAPYNLFISDSGPASSLSHDPFIAGSVHYIVYFSSISCPRLSTPFVLCVLTS